MAPGGAPHRPGKRWPASHYAVLANTLADKGKSPVLIGTSHEAETVADIIDAAPRATSLIGKTSLPELAALARQAEAAIGNDTGPMHMIAAAGTPSVVVYSHDSDPACSAQCGPAVRILRRRYLDELSPAEVVAAMESMTASRS